MNQLEFVTRRWTSRAVASPVRQGRCIACQLRNFVATRINLEEGEGAKATSSAQEKSAFDEIFDGPRAFERSTEKSNASRRSQAHPGSNQNTRLPRTVLGNDLKDNYSSQLNREWQAESRSRGDDRSMPNRGPTYSGAKKFYRGTMTPDESKTFDGIFASLYIGDKPGGSMKPPADDGGFGSTFNKGAEGDLFDYREKTLKSRIEMKRKAGRKRYLSSVLSERVSADKVSEEEIEQQIDLAREEIVSCATMSELWQWAAQNVWGSRREEQLEKAKMLPETSKGGKVAGREGETDLDATTVQEVDESIVAQEKAVEEVRFGMETPYYSPVLLLLLINLRERFRSPESALSVLRIAKNLGPDSFVLGCSPQLYAEALRTRWLVLKDLQGARDTLGEAKDTGILGRGSNEQAIFRSKRQPSENEELKITDIVTKYIKADVRHHVIEGTRRLHDGQTPLVYERQLQLVEEMDELLGNYKERANTSMRR